MNDSIIGFLKGVLSSINEKVNIFSDYNSIDFKNLGIQLSRKKIIPELSTIIAEYNRFFYSNSLGVFVSREIENLGESFTKCKNLAKKQGGRLLTAADYFKLLKEVDTVGDANMMKSLRNPNRLEYLDTTNFDVKDYQYAAPGLILTKDIDEETGLPTKVYSPSIYGNDDFWRYWSFPDNDREYVLARSHIFLLGASCLDGKIMPHERFRNIGSRLVKAQIC